MIFIRVLFALLALASSLEGSLKGACKWKLGIGCIFQNDARFLREWIEFHRLVGVDHFWLYNNNSDDDYLSELKPYIDEGLVELIDWPYTFTNVREFYPIQYAAYEDAVSRAKGEAEWLALLDTDEFLFSPQLIPVPEVLKKFKGKGGVGINWIMFGTSHVEEVPEGALMIEMLTYRADLNHNRNKHVKSIVNPLLVKAVDNPHFCRFKNGASTVTTSGVPFKGPESPKVETNVLRLHHYWTRDEKFLYEVKIPRGEAWGRSASATLKAAEKLNDFEDLSIMPYVEIMKR